MNIMTLQGAYITLVVVGLFVSLILGFVLARLRYKLKFISHDTFANIISSVSEGLVYLDQNGTIVLVNKAAEKLFNVKARRCISKKINILFNGEELSELYQKLSSNDDFFNYYCNFARNDGRQINIRVSRISLLDNSSNCVGIVYVFSDLTEMRLVQDRLIYERDKAQALFNQSGAMMIVFSLTGDVLLMNDQALLTLGYGDCAQDYSLSLENLHQENTCNMCKKIFIRLKEERIDKINTLLVPFVTRDGKEIFVNASYVKFYEGRTVLFSGHNVTKRIHTERALYKAKQEAEIANRSKTLFLANMSHELRTPLNAIIGFSKRGFDMINSASSDKLSSYFRQINQSGGDLLCLLNDLLDLSKLESGKAKYEFSKNSIIELVLQVETEFLSLIEEKKLMLIKFFPETDLFIEVDRNKTLQVLRNVLANAIKFSFESTTLEIRIKQFERQVIVEIKDSGIGIPTGELEEIFNAFSQSSRSNDGAGGTGLGLSISRSIVRAHMGEIWAEHNPEGGAILKIRLPCAAKAAESFVV